MGGTSACMLKLATACPPASSKKSQQRAFDRFRLEYSWGSAPRCTTSSALTERSRSASPRNSTAARSASCLSPTRDETSAIPLNTHGLEFATRATSPGRPRCLRLGHAKASIAWASLANEWLLASLLLRSPHRNLVSKPLHAFQKSLPMSLHYPLPMSSE
jgi:hypothetical protein